MTNTATQTKFTATLEVDPSFSAYTIGQMIADAMAEMQDEPFGTNFDPFWDGPARIVLPLVYQAPGIDATEVGTFTISVEGALECPAPGCNEAFHTKAERLEHSRTHVETSAPYWETK